MSFTICWNIIHSQLTRYKEKVQIKNFFSYTTECYSNILHLIIVFHKKNDTWIAFLISN